MGTSYLVDGYNALHKLVDALPEGPDACREVLLGRIRGRLRGRVGAGDVVHVVFDTKRGGLRAGTHGRDGALSWSYAEGSADDAIVDLARRNDGSGEDGRPIVVVTDDRELRGRCKQLGCATLRVHDWFDARPALPDPPRPGTPGLRPSDFRPSDFGLPDGPIDL